MGNRITGLEANIGDVFDVDIFIQIKNSTDEVEIMRTDAGIVLDILRTHAQGITSSWDWEMDLKFAEKIDDEEAVNLLKELRGSVLAIREHDQYIRPTITVRRLRALRKLVKKGLVESYWVGTGWGGRNDTGVNRLRGYMLTPKGREDGEG